MKQKPIMLDDDQKKAVYAPIEQSTLVIAPPGCGKTLIMAKRIEYLINTGSVKPPFKILGLTFTNAAANEMKNRVTKEVPVAEGIVDITNFHSFAYFILRAYGNRVGIPKKFSVLGEIEKEKILLKIFSRYEKSIEDIMNAPPEYRGKRLQNNEPWSRYKEWTIEKILKNNEGYIDGSHESLFGTVLQEFRTTLKKENLLDFDHILWYAYNLLKDNPTILDYYRASIKYVLVDEFQDTNSLQFKILSLLTSVKLASTRYLPAKVFILADPDQAIYEFQGATPENIEIAKETFQCELVNLSKEYRFSSGGVRLLKSAISSFIRGETLTKGSVDQTQKPVFVASYNNEEEAQYILDKIIKSKENNIPLHEIAIIAFAQSRLIDLKKLLDKENVKNIFVPDFKGVSIERNYHKLFRKLADTINKTDTGYLHTTFEKVCENENFDIENDEVIKVLWNVARRYDHNQFKLKSLWEKNQLFTNEVLLEINWGQVLTEKVKNKVFLSTIHGVKGLQFEVVMICGLEQYSSPYWHLCSSCDKKYMSTEFLKSEALKNLKILYVGISRAKNQLYLTSSLVGNYGHDRHITCMLAPFTEMLNLNLNGGNFCSNPIFYK